MTPFPPHIRGTAETLDPRALILQQGTTIGAGHTPVEHSWRCNDSPVFTLFAEVEVQVETVAVRPDDE